MKHLLLLAGTVEARELAAALVRRQDMRVTASLAGVTESPADLGVPTRCGGFGGAEGLAAYLRQENVDLVVDATHPFAATISANAAVACAATGTALLNVQRPEWSPTQTDDWTSVPTLATAAQTLPQGATAFLATGRNSLAAFLERPDLTLILRAIEPPDHVPPNATVVLARPPFSVEEEDATFRAHRVTHLVTKNSGGASGVAKLTAARRLGLPVIIIDRPPRPMGVPAVRSVADALSWIPTMVGKGLPRDASQLDTRPIRLP